MIKTGFKVFSLLFLTIGFFVTSSANARQIGLSVDLATPVMVAGKSQKAFLKVGLRGFDLLHEADRAQVNLAIVLDKSGSMRGEKIERAKEAAIMAIDLLNSEDIVSVVTYDDVVSIVVPATKVTDKSYIYSEIRSITDGGRTALFAGVSKGAHEVRKFFDKSRVNRVILLSDGLANVGPSTPSELGQLGASLGKEGISVTTIGLGLGYNEDLMTQLAGLSDGNHAFVENTADLARIFAAEFKTAMSVVAKQLTIIIKCADSIRPLRVLGRNADIVGQEVHVYLNQLSSRQEKFVMLEIEVSPGSEGETRDLASVAVSYHNLQTRRQDSLSNSVSVNFTKAREKVKQSVNKPVMESAAEQVVNQMSKDAVKLRDEGKLEAARELLGQSANYLRENAENFNSPYLQKLERETRQDADELDDKNWSGKRKSLRERQFKYDNQQMY